MEDAQLRDQLAIERTVLANERTLLAYLRTALAFAAAGAAILHFYPDSGGLRLAALALVLGGLAFSLVGAWRFVTVRRRLR